MSTLTQIIEAPAETIGLAELLTLAPLLTRVDRKYLLTAPQAQEALAELPPGTRTLQIDGTTAFRYASTYFDTAGLASYTAAAHRRRRRFKVRTRRYLDSEGCWLEVKTRGARGATVKVRHPHPAERADTLDAQARTFVDAALAAAGVTRGEPVGALAPTLDTAYRRTTYLLADGSARATVDTELAWTDRGGVRLERPDLVIVETKTGSTPSALDRRLWRLGHRPTRISKYATGLAALTPDLPAHRWHRTLTHGFAA